MEDILQLPHKLTLNQRENLTLTGVTEVVSFDDSLVVLKTQLGKLTVQGDHLVLQALSVEGGQLSVSGHISSLFYFLTKLFFQRSFFSDYPREL